MALGFPAINPFVQFYLQRGLWRTEQGKKGILYIKCTSNDASLTRKK